MIPNGLFWESAGALTSGRLNEAHARWDLRIGDFMDDAMRLGIDSVLSARLKEQLVDLLLRQRGACSDSSGHATSVGLNSVEHIADVLQFEALGIRNIEANSVPHESGVWVGEPLRSGQEHHVPNGIDVANVVGREFDGERAQGVEQKNAFIHGTSGGGHQQIDRGDAFPVDKPLEGVD